MELTAGTSLERYTIEGTLGSGGMAVVYLARHDQLGSLHAVKVLHVISPAIRDRLLQEGRVQSGLRHPHIVAVTDLVEVEGAPGLVLEYIRGPSLAAWLRQGPCHSEQVDHLARGLIRGVAAAHRHGLIHRDLKPGNVLLAIGEDALVPKVTDFGLAKLLQQPSERHQTRSGMAMGTPAYMAPEQIRDAASVTARADVFSLGAMLYELVTGDVAFDGPDTMSIFEAICAGRYDRGALDDAVPARMRAAIEAALQIDPDDRPADGDELLSLWTGASAGEETPAPVNAWSKTDLDRAESLAPSPQEALTPAVEGLATPTFAVSFELDSGEAPETIDIPDASLDPDSLPQQPMDEQRARQLFWLGMLGYIPFLAILLTTIIGGPKELAAAGYWLWPMLLITVLGMGFMGLMSERLAGGSDARIWIWGAPAVLVTSIGHLGQGVGGRLAADSLALAPLEDRARLAARGAEISILPELVAVVCAACLLLAACDTSAFIFRTRVRSEEPWWNPRATWVLGGTIALGSVLWTFEWLRSDGGPGPAVVFLVLVGTGVAAAFVTPAGRDPRADGTLARLLVAVSMPVGVLFAARVFALQDLQYLFQQAAADGGMVSRLEAAEQFALALESASWLSQILWGGAAALIALAPLVFAGAPNLKPLGMPRQLVWMTLGALLLFGSKLYGTSGLAAAGHEVLPAMLQAAGDEAVGAQLIDGEVQNARSSLPLELPDSVTERLGPRAEEGVFVVQSGALSVRPGDQIIAVEGRAVDNIRGLVGSLYDCHCGSERACALPSCVDAHRDVKLTVKRDGQLVEVVHTLPASFAASR